MDPNDVHLPLFSLHISFPLFSISNPFLQLVPLALVIYSFEMSRALLDVPPNEVILSLSLSILILNHLCVGIDGLRRSFRHPRTFICGLSSAGRAPG